MSPEPPMSWAVVGVPLGLVVLAAVVAFVTVAAERGSGQRLAIRRREQALAHELPYWELLEDDGCAVAVNVDLTYSAFLALQGIDTDCLDNEALNQLSLALHGVLLNLPPGAVLQFLYASDAD